MDISESLKGMIGYKRERSIPDVTPSNSSISDKLASGDPPPVLRMEDNFSLIIGLCLAKMLTTTDYFLDTSSLALIEELRAPNRFGLFP